MIKPSADAGLPLGVAARQASGHADAGLLAVEPRLLGAESLAPTPLPQTRAVLEAIGVALYLTDAEGRIGFYNEAAARLWGRRPDVGELWCGSLRLYHLDGRPMAHDACPMARTLREGQPVQGEMAVAERPDGSRVTFMAYPSPLREANGTVSGALNLLVDITDRIAAERAVGRLNAVKDEFLGLVSHELRTPVTTIFGNAQLLLRAGRVTGRVRRMLADIAQDSERLLGIVENLLMLTRSEAGVVPDHEPQLLSHVVRQSCARFAERRNRTVSFIPPPWSNFVVEADRTYLQLLIDNLLSNADKYSPTEAAIEVTIDVAPDGGEAHVAVLDRGIGLGDAETGELFTPFYRSPSARKRAGGMGIGLTVCKRIAELQGGRIWA
ncbi:MAG TPA: ATP-binding protein, partial [Nonomuraea sp.]|nr:ATP-binding protein [Nonomuraea sp.]